MYPSSTAAVPNRGVAGGVHSVVLPRHHGNWRSFVDVFQASGRLRLLIAPDQVLTFGLSVGIFSYLGLFAVGLVWVLDSSAAVAKRN